MRNQRSRGLKINNQHLVLIFLGVGLHLFLLQSQYKSEKSEENKCEVWNLNESSRLNLIINNGGICRKFSGISGQKLNLKANVKVQLTIPSGHTQDIDRDMLISLGDGLYTITVEKPRFGQNVLGYVVLSIEGNSSSVQLSDKQVQSTQTQQNEDPSNLKTQKVSQEIPITIVQHKQFEKTPDFTAKSPPFQLSYNVKSFPPFAPDSDLQAIVNEIVTLAAQKGLNTDSLSISLVNLQEVAFCKYGGYQDQKPRFPASVAKLFWVVALFGQGESDNYAYRQYISEKDLSKLIQDSDNNSASLIIDYLTRTTSGSELHNRNYNQWYRKRSWINDYFGKAGYNVNLTQKNYPIPELNLPEPIGRELQIRKKSENPTRNYLSTYDVARLLYEIDINQAVSPAASLEIKKLLLRDYQAESLKTYDSIEGFLGEGLSPSEIKLYSKVGWTKNSRQDASIITSRDDRIRYILVIFGDDLGFANDWDIFPDISQRVFDRMTALTN